MKLYDKEQVNFEDMKDGRCYKVIFEESKGDNEVQSIAWDELISNDVVVFGIDEMLRMKQETVCGALVSAWIKVGQTHERSAID